MLFDENGYLTPYDIIITDIETFKQTFVFNERREEIFQNYLALLDIFKGFSNDSSTNGLTVVLQVKRITLTI